MTLKKFLAFLLCFILGFVSCVGAIVGAGYWAYTRVSLNKLNSMGVLQVDPDAIRGPGAEVDLASLTLQGLLAELEKLSKLQQAVTLDTLVERYQLKLPESVLKLLPEAVRSAPITKLLSDDGVKYILENTNVDYLYPFLPSDVLSAPAREALSGKTLAEVVKLDMQSLLRGVKLGYLTGVKYEKDAEGTYVPVYEDPMKPTLLELVGSLDVADALDVFANGGDMMTVISKHMNDVMVEQLIGSMTDLSQFPLQGVFEGLTLGDVLVYDEEQDAYVFDFGKAIRGKTFAELMNYSAVMDESGIFVKEWRDKKGNPVYGIFRGMAETEMDALAEKEVNLMDLMVDVYIGDVMEYRPVFDGEGTIVEWKNVSGVTVSGLNAVIADITLGEFTDPKFEFSGVLVGVCVGDLMGYTAVKDDPSEPEKVTGWLDKTGTALTGMDFAMANVDLGRLMQGGDYKVEDAIGGLYLGELLQYTPVKDSEGDIVGWLDGEKKVSALYARVANLTVGDLMSDDFNFNTVFAGLYLGEVLGYTKDGEKWKNGEADVKGLDGAIANIDLGEMLNNPSYNMADVFNGLYLGELLNYEKNGDGKWCERKTETDPETGLPTEMLVPLSAVYSRFADLTVGEMMKDDFTLSSVFDKLYLGDAIGYERDEDSDGKLLGWLEPDKETPAPDDYKKVTGIDGAIANVDLGQLLNNENYDITAVFNGLYLGEAMGYERGEVLENDNPETADKDETEYQWWKLNEETDKYDIKVEGVEAKLSNYRLGDLLNGKVELSASEMTEGMTVAELLGYTPVYAENETECIPENAIAWKDGNDDVTGVMAAIAGLHIDNLASEIDGVKVGKLMGYTLVEGGLNGDYWLDEEDERATALTSTFADLTVGELKQNDLVTAKLDGLRVGDMLGYEKHGDVWYTEYTDNNISTDDKRADGVMGAIADKKIGELDDPTLGIDAIKLGEILGYEKHGDVWYTEYTENNISTDDKPAEGIMVALADLAIGDLGNQGKVSDAIQGVTVADALGYEKVKGVWYSEYTDNNNPDDDTRADGIMAAIADMTIGELGDPNSGVNAMAIGRFLGYEKHGDVWYTEYTDNGISTDDTPAEGIMVSLADLTIGDLSNQGKVTEAVQRVSVGEALGYVKDGNVWKNNGTEVTGVMAVLADKTIGELGSEDGGISSMMIGELLGYSPVKDGDDKIVGWKKGEDSVGGIIAAIAHLTINQLGGDTAALTDAVKTVKVGEALGYTRDENGVWKNGMSTVTGVIGALADKEIGALDSATDGIGTMPLGELLGYTKKNDGSWLDESKTPAQPVGGVLASIAGLSINSLSDGSSLTSAISGVYVGDAMGYTKDENGVWKNRNATVTGFMATVSSKKISELDSLTSTVTVGELMGYTPVYDEDETECIPENAAYWENGGVRVTGVMAVISSSKIDQLQSSINGTRVGELLSYTEADPHAIDNTNGVNWRDGSGYVSLLINKICNAKLGELGTTMTGLTVADIFTATERNTGFLKLINETTPLTSLGTAITDRFATVTMGELVELEIVSFNENTLATLYLIDVYHWEHDPNGMTVGVSFDEWEQIPGNSWESKTIGGFVNSLGDLGKIVRESLSSGGALTPGVGG